MKTPKIQVKVYAKDPAAVRPAALVPVFHEWIKRGVLSELMIDVVDYAHVHEGPSVLLVGHESDYTLDLGEGRPGIAYSRKRGGPEDPTERVLDALRRALSACKRLEEEPSIDPKLAFSGEQLEIRLNDRLSTPNDEATYAAVKPVVEAALGRVFGDVPFSVKRVQNDSRDVLTLSVTAPGAAGPKDLLARIA